MVSVLHPVKVAVQTRGRTQSTSASDLPSVDARRHFAAWYFVRYCIPDKIHVLSFPCVTFFPWRRPGIHAPIAALCYWNEWRRITGEGQGPAILPACSRGQRVGLCLKAARAALPPCPRSGGRTGTWWV